MVSNKIKFIFNNKIYTLENPDPNKTILNYVRNDLKRPEPKKDVPKVVVEHVRLYWEN